MAKQENSGRENRLLFLDNLKVLIIFFVVLYHVGWVYEGSGMLSSVWIVDDPSKNDLAGIINLVLDMFMMPIMFFISGYFALYSIKAKKGWSFVQSRFKRLMVPWLIATLTLIPISKVIFLYSRDLPQETLVSYFHFSGGILMNQGWLWFLPVLFMFDLLYFILAKVNPLRLNIGIKSAVFLMFLIGSINSICMSLFNYSGWTKTTLLDFQKDRILIYFMAFLLGSLCSKQKVFYSKPTSKKLYYFVCFTSWIPLNVYIIVLLNLFMNPGNYLVSRTIDLVLVWVGFHLSLLSLLYIFISTFRFYFNRKGAIMKGLSEYSYGVYIIHYIVMGGIALSLLNFEVPSVAKYLILVVATFALSNLALFFYREVLQKVVNKLRYLGFENKVLLETE